MEETGILTRARLARCGRSRYHRGTNQSGMRDYNERLVLSLVRRHGSLAKTEIARHDQAVGADRLGHHARARGRRPAAAQASRCAARSASHRSRCRSTPKARIFLGLKIGRRSAELVLIDFLGNVRAMLQHSYRYPAPRETVEFVTRRHQAHARRADAGAGQAHRRARHRHAVRAVELGRRRRARRAR